MKTSRLCEKILGGGLYKSMNENILQCNDVFLTGKYHNKEDRYLSSNDKHLDNVLKGGYPIGKVSEISGTSNVGKTLLALKAMKEVQKQDKLIIYIDASRSFNLDYLEEHNIDKDNVLLIQPETIEQLTYVLSESIKPNIDLVGLIVIDTIADLATKKELESDISTNIDISRSKMIKALLMRIANLIRNTDACALVLNQLRSQFNSDGTVTEIPCFDKWANITCSTRLKLSLDEDDDICVEVSFKDK